MASRRSFLGWLGALVAAPWSTAIRFDRAINELETLQDEYDADIVEAGVFRMHGTWRIPRACTSGDIRRGAPVGVDAEGMVVPLDEGAAAFGVAVAVSESEVEVRV